MEQEPKPRPPSRVRQRYTEAVVKVRQQQLDFEPRVEKIFLAQPLVQVTLPHSEPEPHTPIWTRTNGNLTLSIRPGWDHANQCSLGYPYGTVPRLILFWITTEVLRSKSRTLYLGESLADFMRELELNPSSGGTRSDATRLKTQMERLFRALISFERHASGDSSKSKQWLDMQIVSSGQYWWNTNEGGSGGTFQSSIELGDRFYESILDAPVPINFDALRAFKNSALALDLYSWITYKVFVVGQKEQPQPVPWAGLMQQLGADYKDSRNFQRKAKEVVERIVAMHPATRIDFERGGLVIHPGPLLVARRRTAAPSKSV
jgi:hypothetical protein